MLNIARNMRSNLRNKEDLDKFTDWKTVTHKWIHVRHFYLSSGNMMCTDVFTCSDCSFAHKTRRLSTSKSHGWLI